MKYAKATAILNRCRKGPSAPSAVHQRPTGPGLLRAALLPAIRLLAVQRERPVLLRGAACGACNREVERVRVGDTGSKAGAGQQCRTRYKGKAAAKVAGRVSGESRVLTSLPPSVRVVFLRLNTPFFILSHTCKCPQRRKRQGKRAVTSKRAMCGTENTP
jgi:hypothetical protein